MKFTRFIGVIAILTFFLSYYKEPMDYSNAINDLNRQISSLQNRSDSLANILKITNNNDSGLSKTIDSIKTQLVSINSQLEQLNSQLSNVNANIALISSQIDELKKQYANLLAQLNGILTQLSGGLPTTMNTGLIAYYPFSGNAIDSSVGQNNGTVFGASLTSDRFGNANNAYFFDGKSFIKAKSVQFTDLSFSVWYSIDPSTNLYPSFGHPPTGGQLIGQGTSVGPTNYCDFSLGISKIGNAIPSYAIERGNRATFEMYYSSNQIQFSQWRNIIVTIANNIMKIYENGVLINSYYLTFPFIKNANVLSIGSRFVENAAVPPCNYFIGKIDDVRIYNRILTQDEITYLASH